MIFDSRTYSVLIVSSNEKMASQLSSALSGLSCYPVVTVSSISAAKREALEKTYDFVIINAPLNDEVGTRFALDVSENKSTICLMMLKADLFDEIDMRVSSDGVFTLQKPVSQQNFFLAISWMKSARERLRKMEKKAVTLQDKMEEIRIVNRAKWMLIDKEGLTEEQAHKAIEKQAMDACATKVEIANIIIRKYS